MFWHISMVNDEDQDDDDLMEGEEIMMKWDLDVMAEEWDTIPTREWSNKYHELTIARLVGTLFEHKLPETCGEVFAIQELKKIVEKKNFRIFRIGKV